MTESSFKNSKWRKRYKVHPAADVFPKMSEVEIDALAEDIKANGLQERIVFQHNGVDVDIVVDGRNRLDAMESAGIQLRAEHKRHLNADADAVAFVISANLKRRHMLKSERAEAIVRLAKMSAEKPGHDGPVSEKGGRGKKSAVKQKAAEINAALPKGTVGGTSKLAFGYRFMSTRPSQRIFGCIFVPVRRGLTKEHVFHAIRSAVSAG